jgi:hypothetical protein
MPLIRLTSDSFLIDCQARLGNIAETVTRWIRRNRVEQGGGIEHRDVHGIGCGERGNSVRQRGVKSNGILRSAPAALNAQPMNPP